MRMSSVDIHLKRSVELVSPKTKKPLTDDQIYPLYVVDRDSLAYIEVAEKFWKVIGNPDAEISDQEFPEYLATITKWGLNSVIVPKFELDKYIKRLAKKKESPVVEEEEDDQ